MDMKNMFYKNGWVILGMASAVLLLVFGFFLKMGGQAQSVSLISEENFKKLSENFTKDQRLLADGEISLTLNGYKLPYDKESNIWYAAQNLAKQEWEGVLGTDSEDARLYLLEDAYLDEKQQSIAEGHLFRALLVTDSAYAVTNITACGMPVISIETESFWEPEYTEEDIDNYVYNSETRYVGSITVFDADGNSGTFGDSSGEDRKYRVLKDKVEYHFRGASSGGFAQKSYALKFVDSRGKKKTEALFGLGESAKWKLISAEKDITNIREKTAWQLWAEMAEKQASFSEGAFAMEYCEVILDGEYLGLYGILQGINEDTLGLSERDVLYKVLEKDLPPEEEYIDSVIESGYVVCYPIRIRYPKQGKGNLAASWEPMRQYLRATYWSTDFKKLYSLVEIENTIDYFIFLEAVSASDNAIKNTYRVVKRAGDGSYKMLTIPWDLNLTFGDIYSETEVTVFNPDTTQIYTDPCIQQLFKNNKYGEGDLLNERWTQYRESVLSDEHVLGLIEENMEYLLASGAFQREMERWPDAGKSSDLTAILKFEKERLAFLDQYFASY